MLIDGLLRSRFSLLSCVFDFWKKLHPKLLKQHDV